MLNFDPVLIFSLYPFLNLINKMKPKGNFKKKTKNTDILSAGSKIYAKKRKIKKETVESVDFDPVKRT